MQKRCAADSRLPSRDSLVPGLCTNSIARLPPLQDQIKALITSLMLSTPPIVRAQLSEALSIVSQHDFPAKWPTLLPELTEKLHSNDPNTVHGVLQTANSIYKRYRNQFMTDKLSKDLEYSQGFVRPLLDLLMQLAGQVAAAAADVAQLRVLLSSARLVCRIFYSLNSPGLTEVYFGANQHVGKVLLAPTSHCCVNRGASMDKSFILDPHKMDREVLQIDVALVAHWCSELHVVLQPCSKPGFILMMFRPWL